MKMSSRAEAAVAYEEWRKEAGMPRSSAAMGPGDHAALLSHELRRDLAERLARLGYQSDAGGWSVDRGQGRAAQPARTGPPRLSRLLRGLR